MYSASRKVVGKSARDSPERCCGWLWVHCFPKKFERMAREAMDICLRVIKESNKSRFDSYSQEQCIDHIPYYFSELSRAHFSDNLLEIAVSTVSEYSFRYIEKIRHLPWIINFWKPAKPRLSCARDEHLITVALNITHVRTCFRLNFHSQGILTEILVLGCNTVSDFLYYIACFFSRYYLSV